MAEQDCKTCYYGGGRVACGHYKVKGGGPCYGRYYRFAAGSIPANVRTILDVCPRCKTAVAALEMPHDATCS